MAKTPAASFNDKAKAKSLSKFMHKALDFFAGELDALTFIEQGADIALRDAEGNTALIKAVTTNKEIAVTALLDRNASLTDTDKKGLNALQHAVLGGNKKIAALLASRGAKLSSTELLDLTLLAQSAQNAAKAVDCLRSVAEIQDKKSAAAKTALKHGA